MDIHLYQSITFGNCSNKLRTTSIVAAIKSIESSLTPDDFMNTSMKCSQPRKHLSLSSPRIILNLQPRLKPWYFFKLTNPNINQIWTYLASISRKCQPYTPACWGCCRYGLMFGGFFVFLDRLILLIFISYSIPFHSISFHFIFCINLWFWKESLNIAF